MDQNHYQYTTPPTYVQRLDSFNPDEPWRGASANLEELRVIFQNNPGLTATRRQIQAWLLNKKGRSPVRKRIRACHHQLNRLKEHRVLATSAFSLPEYHRGMYDKGPALILAPKDRGEWKTAFTRHLEWDTNSLGIVFLRDPEQILDDRINRDTSLGWVERGNVIERAKSRQEVWHILGSGLNLDLVRRNVYAFEALLFLRRVKPDLAKTWKPVTNFNKVHQHSTHPDDTSPWEIDKLGEITPLGIVEDASGPLVVLGLLLDDSIAREFDEVQVRDDIIASCNRFVDPEYFNAFFFNDPDGTRQPRCWFF